MSTSYNAQCDVYQGFNYRADHIAKIGFITELKIGTVDLDVDLKCTDPENQTSELPVVAVLASGSWGFGITDAIYLNGQVSINNQQKIKEMQIDDLSNTTIEVVWVTYTYDRIEKKMYKEIHSEGTTLLGNLQKDGGDLALDVAEEPSEDVTSPENFSMYLGIKPRPEAQQMTYQVSVSGKKVKQWGIDGPT